MLNNYNIVYTVFYEDIILEHKNLEYHSTALFKMQSNWTGRNNIKQITTHHPQHTVKYCMYVCEKSQEPLFIFSYLIPNTYSITYPFITWNTENLVI